jgi:outer membrane murein-binding lipoprotein Lpp
MLRKNVILIVLLALLAGQALSTYSPHEEIDKIAARAKTLSKKEKKLEVRLKKHDRRTKAMQAVWRQRRERIQKKIKARWANLDFSKIGATNIKALAAVDLKLTTENNVFNGETTPVEKLRALFAQETDELATLTHEIQTKKDGLNKKYEQLEQMEEQAHQDKEHYDVKMEIYKRRLNFIKFKESLIRETPQKRLEEIQKKKIEEQMIHDSEQKLLNNLKDPKSYAQKKLQEKEKKDEEKAVKLGLKKKSGKNNKVAGSPSSPSGVNVVNHKTISPEEVKNMIPHLGTGALNLQATGISMGDLPKGHDGKSPLVVVNNHQTTIHVHHTPGSSKDTVDGTTRMQVTGVLLNGQPVTPHESNSPIAAVLNHKDTQIPTSSAGVIPGISLMSTPNHGPTHTTATPTTPTNPARAPNPVHLNQINQAAAPVHPAGQPQHTVGYPQQPAAGAPHQAGPAGAHPQVGAPTQATPTAAAAHQPAATTAATPQSRPQKPKKTGSILTKK